MKKTLFIISLFLGLQMSAQTVSEGNSLINLNLGMSYYSTTGTGYKTVFPPLSLSYEYMINDKISVGAVGSYYAFNYEFNFGDVFSGTNTGDLDDVSSKTEGSFAYAGLLGNFHFFTDEPYDIYAGLNLGYLVADVKSEMKDGENTINMQFPIGSGITFGAQVGARYFFNEHLAVNLEAGYGFTLVKGGLTYKLGY